MDVALLCNYYLNIFKSHWRLRVLSSYYKDNTKFLVNCTHNKIFKFLFLITILYILMKQSFIHNLKNKLIFFIVLIIIVPQYFLSMMDISQKNMNKNKRKESMMGINYKGLEFLKYLLQKKKVLFLFLIKRYFH